MKLRKGRNSKNVIFKYKKIFVERDKKHIDFRNFIFQNIVNKNDLYKAHDFDGELSI